MHFGSSGSGKASGALRELSYRRI